MYFSRPRLPRVNRTFEATAGSNQKRTIFHSAARDGISKPAEVMLTGGRMRLTFEPYGGIVYEKKPKRFWVICLNAVDDEFERREVDVRSDEPTHVNQDCLPG